jgi:acyl carrier protein
MSDISTRVKKIIVDLIMEFEKEFNISIPDEQAETITTVGQAITYLEEHAK